MIHELIHSCSISHFGYEVYRQWDMAEELSVHFLSQEIATLANIPVVKSAYDKGVELIRRYKKELQLKMSDLEFASELLKIPTSERFDWLESLNELTADKTVFQYQKLIKMLEVLKKWRPSVKSKKK